MCAPRQGLFPARCTHKTLPKLTTRQGDAAGRRRVSGRLPVHGVWLLLLLVLARTRGAWGVAAAERSSVVRREKEERREKLEERK